MTGAADPSHVWTVIEWADKRDVVANKVTREQAEVLINEKPPLKRFARMTSAEGGEFWMLPSGKWSDQK